MQNISFEAALERLNLLVRELEEGELPLERAMSLFAEGVQLVRHCRQLLLEAEQRVKVLAADLDGPAPETFGNHLAGGETKP
ncbi:MAG: exodeoxyribonuclease VII small subunit [Desulfotomaculales bacterium]